MCFGKIDRSRLTRAEVEGHTCCSCSVRPLEAQQPLRPRVTLEMVSLFRVGRDDGAELLATASGTGEEDRAQEKATRAMTVLSEVQFDWQIAVEDGIQDALLSPFQTE